MGRISVSLAESSKLHKAESSVRHRIAKVVRNNDQNIVTLFLVAGFHNEIRRISAGIGWESIGGELAIQGTSSRRCRASNVGRRRGYDKRLS
jgi:hypothetical protein